MSLSLLNSKLCTLVQRPLSDSYKWFDQELSPITRFHMKLQFMCNRCLQEVSPNRQVYNIFFYNLRIRF